MIHVNKRKWLNPVGHWDSGALSYSVSADRYGEDSDTETTLAVKPPLNELHNSWPSLEVKELTGGEICSLTALNGGVAVLRDRFHKKYRAALPAYGRAVSFNGGHSFCTAPEQWFVRLDVENAFLDLTLKSVFESNVAVTLQSDAWARVAIIGDRAPQVLERLVAIDLSDEAFPAFAISRCSAAV